MDDNFLVKNAFSDNFILKDSFCGKIKLLLDRLGFSHVWDNQGTFYKDRFLLAVEEKWKQNFIDYWKLKIFDNKVNGNKLRTYRKLKLVWNWIFLYLDVDRSAISCFVKIRISNSILNIEKGRHLKIPVEKRICPLCKHMKQEIED